MKVILSRKGFDGESGGCASPIFPNGRYYSVPIPYGPGSQHTYGDLNIDASVARSDVGSVVTDLTKGRLTKSSLCHLDPDLTSFTVKRLSGWRPAFGQVEIAQSHLRNQRVGVGDVFLFHGWFREVEQRTSGKWDFRSGSRDLNVLFGWMQVGEIVDLEQLPRTAVADARPWLRAHPHISLPDHVHLSPPSHAIYLASDRLVFDGRVYDLPGAGVFSTLRPRRVLTADGEPRSHWRLPRWFCPDPAFPSLTNFPNARHWSIDGDHALLRPRGRQGQEAVIDCIDEPGAIAWLLSLFHCDDAG